VKRKSSKSKKLSPEIRHELRAAARSAKRLAEVTGTPFWVVRNGKLVNLHKGRKQTAKQRELIKLLRPFGI
jgi:hypothetical protein